VASLTDKPKQRNHEHPGGHQSTKDYENKDTGRPEKGKPGLANVKTGGSIFVRMPKVMKAITISDDSESNKEQEQELKQQLMDKQPVVETGKDEDDENEDDKDKDDEDWEDDFMP